MSWRRDIMSSMRLLGVTENGVKFESSSVGLGDDEPPITPHGTTLLAFGTIPLYEIGQEVDCYAGKWRVTDIVQTQSAFFFYGVFIPEPPQWVKDLRGVK